MQNEIRIDLLRSALISQSGDIYDFDDVQEFLLRRDFRKPVEIRFLAWLIRFSIIPAARSEWVSKLQSKYSAYKVLCQHFFKESIDTPLVKLENDIAYTIRVDIERTHTWFLNLAKLLHIPQTFLENTNIMVERILSVITLDTPNLSYVQGHDRYAWISLLIGLFFIAKGGLNADFAEAMAFYLSRAFIAYNPISQDIENFSKIEAHFKILDALVEKHVPEAYAMLNSVGHSSMHYALKWELTLFADEHNIHELMYLWDQILGRLEDITDFLRYLCVAHIQQVPIPKMADEMAQAIQRNRNWDLPHLIDFADSLLMQTRGGISFIEKIRFLYLNYCESCMV
ncbi:hypothetical protein TVAG_414200 [Trichomonas vaginalis G3]|uniref:Rab-GAP TBC domain-containing protein n=1 Tax=Trichomonas vaginalis (strain ATCC PRA-98 / G3) TaxID=412133 RepID=A2EC91_TRIV3|nr:TBC domain-containing protein kinase-like protein family [Trichomonas vaginalis G3]EAY09768.1 hypothetical protein TVAG_414200 [Trichomonas vaginalis G3]KAI5550926.1 TBC domain-containing protein kinase-like protein family [Trichomonas vaginalis G3]|eukprot:XP_001321991.1 hypothetical protein [Trichomonas vaginalis G3]